MPRQTAHGSTPGNTGNKLLDRFPEEEHVRLAPQLESKPLKLKELLIRENAPVPDIYFPTTALVSTLVIMEDGSAVETGITGSEGMVGLSTALGLDFDFHRAICQVHGGIQPSGPRLSRGDGAEPAAGRADPAVRRRGSSTDRTGGGVQCPSPGHGAAGPVVTHVPRPRQAR